MKWEETELGMIETLLRKMYNIPPDVHIFKHVLMDARRAIKDVIGHTYPVFRR